MSEDAAAPLGKPKEAPPISPAWRCGCGAMTLRHIAYCVRCGSPKVSA